MQVTRQKAIARLIRLAKGEKGIAMVEATIGTVFLLFAALAAIQLVLTLHGALAAHGAAARSARAYAITGSLSAAQAVYQDQTHTSLASLKWEDLRCWVSNRVAQCEAKVTVPVIVPGGGFFGGGGFTIRPITEIGSYPIGSRTGG